MRRFAALGPLLLAVVGCRDDRHPTAVLTSTHFTLYLYGDASADETTLKWLEADYRDARAYLKFPEGHIDYHLFPSATESGNACNRADGIGACAYGSSVYTDVALHHHELLHAYMSRVGAPVPLLQEGIAEGLFCAPRWTTPPLPAWRTTVTLPMRHPDLYSSGMALFVYLVRAYGIDRFVAYYASAHDTRDPEVFRREFEAFWGISLDTTWEDMQVPARPGGGIFAVCSCTQPTLPLDGEPVDLTATDTSTLALPDADRGPYLFRAEAALPPVQLSKCAPDAAPYQLVGGTTKVQGTTIARLLPEPYYIAVRPTDSLAAQRGAFVASTCAATVPVTVPAGYTGTVDIALVRAEGDPLESDWYVRLALADARTVQVKTPRLQGSIEICGSCDTSGPDCATLAAGEPDLTLNPPGGELVLHIRHAGQPTGTLARTTLVLLDP